MKIQLALDRLTEQECFRIADETSENIDWIEIGTGVIKEYGMKIVREMKAAYPEKTIVADMKTCDAGNHEAEQAFKAGADVMTVMGFSPNSTIKQALEIANAESKKIMIDLLGIQDAERVKNLYELGADLFCLHIGKDMQNEGSIAHPALFSLLEGLNDIEVAIAGGISERTAGELMDSMVDVVIVGSAITGNKRPKEASSAIRNKLKK
ncbi:MULTISPECIES: 3-hexulose-6-phosphate synthase [unclassified Cytobacillus]|uniref:3-hexulose-6-phosphate synthase n=1 Tax=unclassified Cytobacillus TaxID=2675268 RepID=UPI00203CDB6A|nr:3-hexulose-6-phosphate synthase [Cytobacillus sp. AMY 15.2]MCM3093915.1 orotidine 5'-phosphate decarboxylase [Cytobacillus sp. AMY 15.2]